MKLLACLVLAGAVHGAWAAPAATSPIPVEQFFQKPQMTGASISPDGRYVALRTTSPDGRSVLKVLNAETREQKLVAGFGNADIDVFYWLNERRLAYTVINVDHGGEIGDPGLYAVDRDGKNFIAISPTRVTTPSFADTGRVGADYLEQPTINGFQTRKEDEMYVISATAQDQALARINTRIGLATLTDVRAPVGTYRWLTGADGEPRVAVARRDGKEVVFFYQEHRWRELAAFKPDAPEAFTPLLYADDTLYVRAYRGNDESAVYRYDLKTGAIADKPTITVPGFDADGYFLLGDTGYRGFRVHTDSENTVWFDAGMKALQKDVDDLLPGTINTLSYGARSATPYVLVDAHRDIQDHIYFLYQRDSKKLLKLGAARPQLDPDRMTATGLIRYPARDGLQIPAYVSVPEGAGKRAPTVVLIADPQGQRNGYWEWSAEVQFLASRGYVVLQPNPRGTRGFGAAFEKAGQGQTGAAVQDDIVDAVKWAVKQGYTDARRVCIVGTGYGGYAAMLALSRDPYGFKCGVSWSGMTALDGAKLDAAAIQQPVLLAYGKADSRVPYSDGRKFYDALAAANKQAAWLEYAPSVEDWKTQSNRVDLWRHIESFLGQNLAP